MRETRRILLLSIIILLVSQAFMIVLASNSFEKIHVASELTSYAVPQKDFKRKIEAAMRFGKSLDNLLGMDSLMAEYAGEYPSLVNIEIYSADDQLLHGLHPVPGEQFATLREQGKRIAVADPMLEVVEVRNAYLIAVPLSGPDENRVGSAVFFYDKQSIQDGVRLFWKKRLILGGIIAGCASLLLLAFLIRVGGADTPTPVLRKRIFFRVLGVIVLAQLVFAGVSAQQFHHEHVQAIRDRVMGQLELLRTEMERVLARGIGLERITRMDAYLAEILIGNPEVMTLGIRDADGHIHAQARLHPEDGAGAPERTMVEDGSASLPARAIMSSNELSLSLDLRGPGNKEIFGELRADLDRSALWALIWKILLDSLTVTLIASLFIVEQIYFLISRIGRHREDLPGDFAARDAAGVKAAGAGAPTTPKSDQDILDKLMLSRFAAFAFLFAFALPVSFIPLQMRELYTPLAGLPRDMVLGLPIALEMLCALMASLLSGSLADRFGWRIPFLAGIVVTALGLLFCAQAATGGHFILARGVCGIGYGLSWMALQTFLFANSTPTTRARGSSHFVAGIFSGHICGTALGAMLAERFGYSPVFLLGMFMALGSLIFFFLFMRATVGETRLRSPAARPEKVPTAMVRPQTLARYLFDRNTFLLIFCCVIPFSICQVGLLFFATPLYLDHLNVNQSDIGRVLMIYGLSVVYLAPQLSKIVDRHERKIPFIVAGGLVGGLGLSLLYLHQGFLAVIGAIFLLGLASSIGSSAQTSFALKLRSTHELGAGKAMAIQRAADKLGQMLGPLALGALMSGVSISQGLVVLGMGYMAVSVLFLILAREHEPDLLPEQSPAA